MNLICIESVRMTGDKPENQFQVFTKGKVYKAKKSHCQGLNGDPYENVPILSAKNDKGESHIIKHLNRDTLDSFFCKHFNIM